MRQRPLQTIPSRLSPQVGADQEHGGQSTVKQVAVEVSTETQRNKTSKDKQRQTPPLTLLDIRASRRNPRSALLNLELDQQPPFPRNDPDRARPLARLRSSTRRRAPDHGGAADEFGRIGACREDEMHSGDFGRVDGVEVGEEVGKVVVGGFSGDCEV